MGMGNNGTILASGPCTTPLRRTDVPKNEEKVKRDAEAAKAKEEQAKLAAEKAKEKPVKLDAEPTFEELVKAKVIQVVKEKETEQKPADSDSDSDALAKKKEICAIARKTKRNCNPKFREICCLASAKICEGDGPVDEDGGGMICSCGVSMCQEYIMFEGDGIANQCFDYYTIFC
ncbi:hypothetical protein TrLO_g14771 [Triparma laevis f. longispina]|uniref:Uncharacterized protein n=1 Tax=Triparma laevis f. longispina TaxID=1714387 RepID=A0A9W6ZG87_9STRA|nr:hypothetical protein TrLO_g14771 [Triparma laevis f. longispina]